MRSFEYDYLLEIPISHLQGMTLRALGEYRGRQALYVGYAQGGQSRMPWART